MLIESHSRTLIDRAIHWEREDRKLIEEMKKAAEVRSDENAFPSRFNPGIIVCKTDEHVSHVLTGIMSNHPFIPVLYNSIKRVKMIPNLSIGASNNP